MRLSRHISRASTGSDSDLFIAALYSKRAEKLPDGLFRWIPAVLKHPDREIVSILRQALGMDFRLNNELLLLGKLEKNGLDAYLLVRFLRLLGKRELHCPVTSVSAQVKVSFLSSRSQNIRAGMDYHMDHHNAR